MQTIEVRAANLVVSGHTEEYNRENQWLDLSAEQIRDRAFANTEVLTDILEQQECSYWHHGGLNE